MERLRIRKLKLTKLERLVAGVVSATIGLIVARGLVSYGEEVIKNFNDYVMTFPDYTQNFIEYR